MPIAFSQHIGANDALRTGTYSKTLTFTLSTTPWLIGRRPRGGANSDLAIARSKVGIMLDRDAPAVAPPANGVQTVLLVHDVVEPRRQRRSAARDVEDPQRQVLVLVERLGQGRVLGRAVDEAVDAPVDREQRS